MYRSDPSHRTIGLAASTALAAALLAGCTTANAPRADLSAGSAEAALASGRHQQAIAQAEAAVLADPRNAEARAALGQAYLGAGRFASAATSFDDAVQLGDRSPRTALSKAIALLGAGDHAQAAALLSARQDDLPAADLGLALALAGQPDRGIQVLSTAIRAGGNDAKSRQNLAYAYALAGRWREARLMAQQDVPADKVGERMEQWAMTAQPEEWQSRIAVLIDAPAGVADAGQPVHLALGTAPARDRFAAIEPAPVATPAAGELPALALAEAPAAPVAATVRVAPAAQPPALAFDTAFAAPAQVATPLPAVTAIAQDSQLFVAAPAAAPAAVRAPTPARAIAAAPTAASRAPAATRTAAVQSTHLVQLGSFSTEASARRAWSIYQKRYPELSGHQMVISEAVVRGKHYYRVSAAGFGRASSSAMCGRVKSSGEGCFAYAEGRPLPGAIDRGTRLAMR
ncbi:MAG: hypothetical protein B7Z08_05170 [Sphingomonadales bacterium 32-68-7]|nr:MAG: hypothetical protein B7Z33_07280 [Sphingomonadales bacterium 12-68-11]OYX09461.1 MAG: hypothetical protein B7Z08_05170 [Sphingomonadales bacterium 32-68-7]